MVKLLVNRQLQPPGTDFAFCIFFFKLHFLSAEKDHKPDKFTDFMETWTEDVLVCGQATYEFFWVAVHRTIKAKAPAHPARL